MSTRDTLFQHFMAPYGYGEGSIAMKGSIINGFTAFEIPDGVGEALENIAPQPDGCF